MLKKISMTISGQVSDLAQMSNCPKLPKYHESKRFGSWGATCSKTTHANGGPNVVPKGSQNLDQSFPMNPVDSACGHLMRIIGGREGLTKRVRAVGHQVKGSVGPRGDKRTLSQHGHTFSFIQRTAAALKRWNQECGLGVWYDGYVKLVSLAN